MKVLSTEETRRILAEIGHVSTVEAFKINEYDEVEKHIVLNNSMCYSIDGNSLGGSNNDANAEVAIEQICKSMDRKFTVRSAYFQHYNGTYQIA